MNTDRKRIFDSLIGGINRKYRLGLSYENDVML